MTEHFSLEELTRSDKARRLGIPNVPNSAEMFNLQRTAEMLERIRAFIKAPMIIHSGYRSPALNKAVGGVPSSDHVRGMAADFSAPQYGSPREICKALAPAIKHLGIGQLIYESVKGKEWVHVSTRSPEKIANAVITINDSGTFLGIQGVA